MSPPRIPDQFSGVFPADWGGDPAPKPAAKSAVASRPVQIGLGLTDMPISIGQQIAAAGRELALREKVYPRWIEAGTMTSDKARHEIACMKAIVATLQSLNSNRKDSTP